MKTKRRTSSRILAFLLSFIMVTTTFISDYTVVRAEEDVTVSESSNDSSTSDSSSNESSDSSSDESSSEEAGAEDADSEDGDSEESISEETSDGADSTNEEGSVEGDKAGSEDGESEETTEDAESEEGKEVESEEELGEEEELPIDEVIVDEEQVVIIFKASEGGSVSMEKQELGEDDNVEAVLATADDGYEFVNWTKDGKVVSTDEEFTPDKENAKYVAHFVAEEPLEFNQSVTRKGIKISLYAKPGVLPNDAELRVNAISTSTENEIKKAIDEMTEESVEETFSFDINIYSASAGGYVQPEDGTVEVRFDLADKDIDEEASLSVYHVETNSAATSVNNVEEVAAPEKGASEIGFDAEHFSIYTVTIQLGNNKPELKVTCRVSDDKGNNIVSKTIQPQNNDIRSLSDISESIFEKKPYHFTGAYIIQEDNTQISITDLNYANSSKSWQYKTENDQWAGIVNGDTVVFEYDLAVKIQVVKTLDKNSHAATDSSGLKYENVYITLPIDGTLLTCEKIAEQIIIPKENEKSFSYGTIRFEGQGNGNEGIKSFDLYALRYKYVNGEYEIEYQKDKDGGWSEFLDTKYHNPVLCAHYLPQSTVQHTLTVDPNGGTWDGKSEPSTFSMNINETKDIQPAERKDYSFAGWTLTGEGSSQTSKGENGDITFKMGSENATLVAKWLPLYKVNHYLQNLPGAEHQYTWVDTERFYGETGTFVTPGVKTYPGFTSPSKQTIEITGDAKACVHYYYDRIQYTLTVDPNGGIWNENSSSSSYTILYGDSKDIQPAERAGYTFAGWTLTGVGSSQTSKGENGDITFKMGSENATLVANWSPNKNTLYKVNHFQQNLPGSEHRYKWVDTERCYGETGTSVTPDVRTYDGFTSPSKQTITITGDGEAHVNYYYDRISYTIAYDYNNGSENWENDSHDYGERASYDGTKIVYTRLYGEAMPTFPAGLSLKKESTELYNYEFIGWSEKSDATENDAKFPKTVKGDATYYAVYEESDRYVGYTVQYYLQTERNKETYEHVEEDDKVVLYDAKNNTAQAGSSLATDKLAEYAEKAYAGYAYDSTLTVNPEFSTEDSKNIVKLYYNLVDYKVVLNANGGAVHLSPDDKNYYDGKNVYYDVDENDTTSELIYTVRSIKFNLPVEPSISKTGQTFLGWKQVNAQGVWETIVAFFTPKAEVVTINVAPSNSRVITYAANWKGNTGTSLYVLLPGYEPGKNPINEVTAKELSGRKNFSSNYYTAKLGTVDVASNLTDTFKGAYYERQPADDFGTSVEAYMSGYQYQDSSNLDASSGTLKVNDYKGYSYTADINSVDWYVVKDSSTSNTPNWHVDGLPNWEKGDAVNYTLAIDLNDSANYPASVAGGVYATKNGVDVKTADSSYTVEDVVMITNPARPGYTFEGWKAYYTNGEAQYNNYDGTVQTGSVRGATGNLTFVAQWIADEYTIKYQTYNNATSAFINDNLATKSFNVENVADSSFAVTAPAYDGLAFKGWYTVGGDLLTKETEIPTTSVLKQADPELKGAYQNATVVARYNATMTVSAKDVTKVYSTSWQSSDVNPVASVEGAKIQFFSEQKYYDQAVAGGAIEGIRTQGRMYVRDVAERIEYFVATKDGYEPAFGSAKFTVTKRPLVLQANSATKKYDGNVLTETGYKVITETQNIDGVEVTGLEMPEYLDGDNSNPIKLTVVTEGSQLYVGTSPNVIKKDNVKIETTTVPEGRWNKDNAYEATNYEIYVLPGTLEVTKGEIAITVEASDDTKVYDGTALTANSYKALSAVDKAKLDAAGDHLVVTVEGSATLVSDSVAGNNQVTDVKVYHGDGTANDVTENYNINTQDGTLTITSKPIVLTAANVSKQYDGKPFDLSTFRNPVFTVADAAVDGEGKVVISDGHAIAEAGTTGVVGDQYVVPESVSLQVEPIVAGEGKTSLDASGIMIYAPAGVPMILADDLDDVTGMMNDNYAIYYAPGKVSITNESLVEVALTAASGTYTYNGSAFTIDSYARTAQEGFDPDSAIDNWTFTVVDGEEEHEIQVNTSATAVGTYTVPFTYVNAAGEVVAVTEDDEIKVYDGVIGAEGTNDVTKYIKVTLVNGAIQINAAPAQGGGGAGGGGGTGRAAAPVGDVLGAKRREDALVEEGDVLGATRAPKTSDSAKAILWMLVMGSSAIGAAAVMAQRKKEEQK